MAYCTSKFHIFCTDFENAHIVFDFMQHKKVFSRHIDIDHTDANGAKNAESVPRFGQKNGDNFFVPKKSPDLIFFESIGYGVSKVHIFHADHENSGIFLILCNTKERNFGITDPLAIGAKTVELCHFGQIKICLGGLFLHGQEGHRGNSFKLDVIFYC